MTIDELKVKISADTADLKSQLKKTQTELENLSKQFNNLQNTVSSTSQNIGSSMSRSLNGVSTASKKATSAVNQFMNIITRINSATKEFNISSAFNTNFGNMQAQIATNQQEISLLTDKLAATNTEIKRMILAGQQDSPMFQQQVNDASKLQARISLLRADTDILKIKLKDLSNGASFEQAQNDANILINRFKELDEQIDKVRSKLAKITTFETFDDGELRKLENELGVLLAEREQLERDNNIKFTVDGSIEDLDSSNLENSAAKTTILQQAYAKIMQFAEQASGKILAFGEANQRTLNGISKAASAVGSAFQTIGTATINVAKRMNVVSPLLSKLSTGFKSLASRVKNVVLYSTLIAGFREFENTIKSYLSTNSALQSALGSLKGSWLTAFQPIYDACVPALVTLINWLAKLGSMIASISSSIFGGTAKSARASASALYDQAAATAAAGGAAEEAQRQIMGFDEINKLEDNSGGGGGGADSSGMAANFEEPDTKVFNSWGDAFDDLIKRLISKLPKLDEVLQSLAKKINSFNDKLAGMFTDNNAVNDATVLFEGIANVINRFNETLDLGKLGQAIGATVQFIFNQFNTLISKINWQDIGDNIAQGINGLFANIKLSSILESITNIVSMVWETLNGLVKGIDWLKIGEWIAEGLSKIDIVSVIKTITDTVISLLKGLITAVKGLLLNVDWGNLIYQIVASIGNIIVSAGQALLITIGGLFVDIGALIIGAINNLPSIITNALASVSSFLADLFKALGLDTVAGFFDGITEKLRNVAQYVTQWFQPFIDAVKNFFGIHSPSTLMKGLGNNIAIGFLDGMKEKWGDLTTWISEKCDNIKTTISNKWNNIKTATASAWENIKEKITSPLKNSTKETSNELTNMQRSLDNQTASMKTSVSNTMAALKNTFTTGFNNIASSISSKMSQITSSFTTALNGLKGSSSSIFSNLASSMSSQISSMVSTCQNAANRLRGIFNVNGGKISVTVPNIAVGWRQSKAGNSYAYVPNYWVYSYSTFAQGGFPEDGMFFANSGELVGEFSNGKTAVANNAQIIEGIKQGVESGVVNALRISNVSNSTNGKQEISIYLDGAQMAKRIYPYIETENNYHGMSLINS